MHAAKAHARTSLISLAVGIVLLAGGLLDVRSGWAWFAAHGIVLTLGCVMAGLAALHAYTLTALARTTFPERPVAIASWLWLAGTMGIAMYALLPWGWAEYIGWLGAVVFTAGATMWSVQVMKHAPKKGLVDMAKDKLTKGDDACLKHVHFSHRFLPIGSMLLIAALIVGGLWGGRLYDAAIHIIVVGYGLLSIYGLSHFWVPRLSGIPAIAAGAIKGELHTTLLGIVGVTTGFIVGVDTTVGRGFLVGLGPMVFLGFFVWMGVLGANIMKNKSPSNSVRPEFVYIPWTFSAVFWLVAAVLMGIFLNVLPDTMMELYPTLRFAHLHVGLVGGAIQLLLGLMTRMVPMHLGRAPPRFGSGMKGSFYLFNAALAFAVFGRFEGIFDIWVLLGFAGFTVSLGMYGAVMAPFFSRKGMPTA